MALIEYKDCSTCSIKKTWPQLQNPVMKFTGPTEPVDQRILILGEAPGADEDYAGQQFVGKTGNYLRDRIPREWRNSLYWQNVVRCRPTDGPRNRNPLPQEISCCSSFLEDDLLAIKPKAILGVGSIALDYFYPSQSISKLRGIPFPIQLKDKSTCWFMPTFHPSYVVRMERKNEDYEMVNYAEPVFRNDILNFFNLLEGKFSTPPKISVPPKQVLFPKTKEEAWNLFEQLDDIYAIDFETFKLRPYMRDALLLTCGCSDGKLTFAFPVQWPGDLNPWGKELLTRMMATKKRWVAQSSTMELTWIRYVTGQHDQLFEDTEVLARLNHNRPGVGSLSALSTIYLGYDIKKSNPNMDKLRMREYPLLKVLKYNGLDAWATIESFYAIGTELAQRPNQLENYARTINTVSSVVDMELHGLDVDMNVAESMQKALYQQSREQEKVARAIPEVLAYERKESVRFSLTSPPAIAKVLTRYCGIKLEQDPETLNYSTDEEVLTPLMGTHPLIDLVLESRGIEKLLSTNLDPILSGRIIAKDGLIHSRYKPVHVVTYRLSSEEPNMQNWPVRKNKEVRRMIIPPKGYVIVKFDYAGLEVRVLCMASNDVNLIQSILNAPTFLGSKDIHWYWLERILKLYPQYMTRLAEKTGEKDEKKILDGGRTIIKADFVFSSFYGSKAGAISHKTLIPRDILNQLHSEFWGKYTNVKKWIDGQFIFYQKYGYVESLTGRARNQVLPGNEVINTPCQGTGAEIVLEAENALDVKAHTEDIHFLSRLNVHDDLTFMLPDTNDLERYIKVIGHEMTIARFPFVSVPLTVEPSVGYNWCDMVQLDKITGVPYAV